MCDGEEKIFSALQDAHPLLIPDLLVLFSYVLSAQSLFCVENKCLFVSNCTLCLSSLKTVVLF